MEISIYIKCDNTTYKKVLKKLLLKKKKNHVIKGEPKLTFVN